MVTVSFNILNLTLSLLAQLKHCTRLVVMSRKHDSVVLRDHSPSKANEAQRRSGGLRRDSGGSWEEVVVEEDLSGGDLGPHTHALRKAIQSSDAYSTLSKQVLLNQLDGLEHMAVLMASLERSRPGSTGTSPNHVEALHHYGDFLCSNITMDDAFYSALIGRGVISSGMAEEMYAVGTRRRQCATLLDLLKVLGNKSYKGFLGALKDTNQEFLVQVISSYGVEGAAGPTGVDVDLDCPSLDRSVSVKSEHLVLPIACYPKSGRSILLDICVPDNGKSLVNDSGKLRSRMSRVRTLALIKNKVRLCRELFAEIIFDSMIEDEVLTTDITEAIFLVGARHRMNQVFLYILPFFGDVAFESFVSALKKTGQGALAILLEEYVLQHNGDGDDDSDAEDDHEEGKKDAL